MTDSRRQAANTVYCEFCGAKIGENCRTRYFDQYGPGGFRHKTKPHKVRIIRAVEKNARSQQPD